MIIVLKHLGLVSLLALSGCSAGRPLNEDPRGRLEFEVVSPQDQVVAEVQNTRPDFTIPAADALIAEQRVRLFFQKYGSQYVQRDRAEGGYVAAGRCGKYVYRIEQRIEPKGVHYRVACAGNPQEQLSPFCELNTRNISRFIQTGTLELGMLRK